MINPAQYIQMTNNLSKTYLNQKSLYTLVFINSIAASLMLVNMINLFFIKQLQIRLWCTVM